MDLRRDGHHVYRLMYHFVWIPKYRHKVFVEPYRSALKAIIEKVGYDYDIEIIELEVPVDHIHMVARTEPKVSPSKVMQVIKSISARECIQRSGSGISGAGSYGPKVTTSRRSAMRMKKSSANTYRINLWSWTKAKSAQSSWGCSKTRSLAAEYFMCLIAMFDSGHRTIADITRISVSVK